MNPQKLRDMAALAADGCDPELNRALLEAAAEIERLLEENMHLKRSAGEG